MQKPHVVSKGEQNGLDLTGDVTFGDEMRFKVDEVHQLDLRPFFMMEHWKEPKVSFTINGDLSSAP